MKFTKNTKKKQNIYIEIVFTLAIAFILSVLIANIISFILAIFGLFDKFNSVVETLSGIVFGLIVGYKLNDLSKQSKK